jgi:basic membrane protein A and related proteins
MSTLISPRSLVLALLTTACSAAMAQPAVIYDMGGKFDKSFNQAAYNGAERWKKESGKTYLEFEVSNPAQREQAFRRMAERGANPIVGIGFSQGSSVEKVAKDFPKLKFAIIDSVVALPNVQSTVFKEHEGSFLRSSASSSAASNKAPSTPTPRLKWWPT